MKMLRPILSARIAMLVFIITGGLIFSSCDEYESFRNDPPEINTFTVPKEVRYGETVELTVGVSDPENDDLTYTWHVSAGTLSSTETATVEWTAPELTDSEIQPDEIITVHIAIRDQGEETVSKSETITVYSKAHRVADALSGHYQLIKEQVGGQTTEALGSMRLTTTTFTREYQENETFFYGSYQLIEPFDERKGTIYWFSDGSTEPITSTYTWDGELLVLYWTATSTGHVYQKRK